MVQKVFVIHSSLQMIGVSVAKSYLDGEEPEVGEMIVTTDYISAGNLIGEMGLLTSSRTNSSCTCESPVQVSKSFCYSCLLLKAMLILYRIAFRADRKSFPL